MAHAIGTSMFFRQLSLKNLHGNNGKKRGEIPREKHCGVEKAKIKGWRKSTGIMQ